MTGMLDAWKAMGRGTRLGVGAAIGVVVCVMLYRGAGHGNSDEAQISEASTHYVRAGAVVCDSQYQASSQARIGKGVFKDQIVPGCQEVGANIEVNILGESSFNGIDVVKVGTRGVVAWAATDDVQ